MVNDDDWLLNNAFFSTALCLAYLTLNSQVVCPLNGSAVLKGLRIPFSAVSFYGGFFS